MAQSAPKRNRRPQNVRSTFQPVLGIPELLSTNGNIITIRLKFTNLLTYEVFGVKEPVVGGGFDANWVFEPVIGTPAQIESYVLLANGHDIEVTGDVPMVGTYLLRIPPWTPEYRTQWGGWIAPARIPFETS